MATIQFDLVSPERKLASVAASEIQIPGADGDFTAMAEHAPMLTTLRPGLLSVKTDSVLAEQALPKGEVTSDVLDGLIADATAAAEAASADDLDAANKRLADTKALLDLV